MSRKQMIAYINRFNIDTCETVSTWSNSYLEDVIKVIKAAIQLQKLR